MRPEVNKCKQWKKHHSSDFARGFDVHRYWIYIQHRVILSSHVPYHILKGSCCHHVWWSGFFCRWLMCLKLFAACYAPSRWTVKISFCIIIIISIIIIIIITCYTRMTEEQSNYCITNLPTVITLILIHSF